MRLINLVNLASIFAIGVINVSPALADNALTSEQLLKSIQASVKDYASIEPDMSRSISGLRTLTRGSNALVTIELNADGMKMSAKYLCSPQGQDMTCSAQQ